MQTEFQKGQIWNPNWRQRKMLNFHHRDLITRQHTHFWKSFGKRIWSRFILKRRPAIVSKKRRPPLFQINAEMWSLIRAPAAQNGAAANPVDVLARWLECSMTTSLASSRGVLGQLVTSSLPHGWETTWSVSPSFLAPPSSWLASLAITQSYSISFSNLKKNKSGQVEHRRWKFQIQSFSSNVTWEEAKEAIFWFLPVGGATKTTTTFICACLKRSIRTRTKKKNHFKERLTRKATWNLTFRWGFRCPFLLNWL